MEYVGKLYGKLGNNKYFDIGKTSEDFDNLGKENENSKKFIQCCEEDISDKHKKIKDYEDKSEKFLLWFNNNTYKNKLDTQFLIELGNHVSDLRDIGCV